MELAEGGSLAERIHSRSKRGLSALEVLQVGRRGVGSMV